MMSGHRLLRRVLVVTRLQGVHLVDITVDENRGPVVVGKATRIHAIQRVRHSGRRARSTPYSHSLGSRPEENCAPEALTFLL